MNGPSTIDKFRYFDQKLKGQNYSNPSNLFPLPNAISLLIIKNTFDGMTAKGGLRAEFESNVTYNEVLEALVKHVAIHEGCIASKLGNRVSGSDDAVECLWGVIKDNPSAENIKRVQDIITTNPGICMEMAKCYIDDNIERQGALNMEAYKNFPKTSAAYDSIDQYYQKYNGYGQR